MFDGNEISIINEIECTQIDPLGYSNSVYVAYGFLGLVTLLFVTVVYIQRKELSQRAHLS